VTHGTLFAGMPNATFKDSTVLVNGYRVIKSDQELVYTRRAARIVQAVHQCIAEIYDASPVGADGHGGDYPAIIPLLPSGADVSAPHLAWV
jgi:ectoine hydrolase